MDHHEEEQRNELEALQEIYYNEIEVLSSEPPISLVIKVKSQSSNLEDSHGATSDGEDGDDEDDDDGDDYEDSDDDDEGDTMDDSKSGRPLSMEVSLKFDLPPKYPDEKPDIEILNSRNLDDYDLRELLSNIQDKADESLGTVMVFTLINEATEWIVTKTTRMKDEIQEEKERKAKADEEEHEKRFEGTRVTAASFLAWKNKFDAEMLKAKLERTKLSGQDEGAPSTVGGSGQRRLTGREMFETDKSLIESDLNFEDLDLNQIESLLQIDDDAADELDPDQFDNLSGDEDDDDDSSGNDDSCDDDDEPGDSEVGSSKKG